KARPCTDDRNVCRRYLSGRIDVAGVLTSLESEGRDMGDEPSENPVVEPSSLTSPAPMAPPAPHPVPGWPQDHVAATDRPGAVTASGCGCAACAAREASPPLVFALGRLGYDLVSEARRDSLSQHMDGSVAQIGDPTQLLAHLSKHEF